MGSFCEYTVRCSEMHIICSADGCYCVPGAECVVAQLAHKTNFVAAGVVHCPRNAPAGRRYLRSADCRGASVVENHCFAQEIKRHCCTGYAWVLRILADISLRSVRKRVPIAACVTHQRLYAISPACALYIRPKGEHLGAW